MRSMVYRMYGFGYSITYLIKPGSRIDEKYFRTFTYFCLGIRLTLGFELSVARLVLVRTWGAFIGPAPVLPGRLTEPSPPSHAQISRLP